MMFHQPNKQSGFSLVETLVAITILLIVITGPLTLISNSARSTNFANDQVMAYFLAQEGLELTQAIRDDIMIPTFDTSYSGSPDAAWNEFIGGTGYSDCFTTSGCGLDQETDLVGTVNVYSCSGSTNPCRLHLNTIARQRSKYTHVSSGNTPTRYTRVITMDDNITGQVEVMSRVTWRSDGQRTEQAVETVTYLFNVYGR
jgi:prepilin-type N-terminal cleavage/methylation domain-containing protein